MKRFLAWTMVFMGGFFFLDGVLCIPVAVIADDMTLAQRMLIALMFIAMAAVGAGMSWRGFKRLAVRKEEITPPPIAEQQKRSEIGEDLSRQTGAIQANLTSHGTTAKEEALEQLVREKTDPPKQMTETAEEITVQDALDTFPPEQQKRFSAQLYQYSQDTGRDGCTPEDAAARRGLVFADGKPVSKEVGRRLDEMRQAAAVKEAEKRKNPQTKQTHSVQAIDYPVPFTKLLIYPNRAIQSKRSVKILHEYQSASYGTRFKDKVSLYDTGTPHELIWEHEEQSEYGTQYDQECTVHAWLSMHAESIYHIPLTHWILSLQSHKLRPYTDCVCITMNENQTEGDWRSITLKESHNTSGHDQLGWNCIRDEISLRFHRDSTWSLCRSSIWREAPSGLPYTVFIEMNLLPGMEKDETLCNVIESLPWNNPNEADMKMREVRDWLNINALHKKVEHLTAQLQTIPSFRYEAALREAKQQLRRLETKAYCNELPKIKNWTTIFGKPGYHGDVMRIGFANGICYLEITNDGYPNRMASGGFVRTVPPSIVCGKRLDARKFEQFYRSIYPSGENLNYSAPIWIYAPIPGRPEGNIEVIQHLSMTENRDGAFFAFEKTVQKRDVVKVGERYYLRETNYQCTAEANSRPVYTLEEAYHVTDASVIPMMTAENGLDFAEKTVEYRYEERGTDVLF